MSDAARTVAYEVLRAVASRGAYANLALPHALRSAGLTGRDAALATELTYGTLRHRGTYDAVLAVCIDRPLAKLDPPVLDALRLGTHQLLRTRIPGHAAVSSTVAVAKEALGSKRAGFVNAVLRRVADRDEQGWIDAVAPDYDDDPVGHLAVAHAHPPWVVRAMHEALGGSWTDTSAALAADNDPADVVVCARPGLCTVDEIPGRPGRWSPSAVLVDGDPAAVPAVREGRAGVQDEGSQLVAYALAAAEVPTRPGGEVWLDACAGPGGKAALLAALAEQQGARLVAAERRHRRSRLVRRALQLSQNAQAVTADGRAGPWRADTFDRVLVDAPCSGLGSLRRRPEARWRRTPGDVADLVRLQGDLLRAALTAVRPGGVVGYVTCSPHLAETTGVVDLVTGDTPGVDVVDARPLFPGRPHLGSGPWVQLWPHLHGTDAMFAAVLRKRED
ncbi:MAG: rRNA cytosine-C5-methyltransferase [Streptosporangiales bacterium]|nr:rRNA cytosine-C5-methyltransferase [Streptosporangiales bacterium]